MIIADENLHQQLINTLLAANYEIFSIRDQLSGISDHEVAAYAKYKRGMIITEDKDFGELVYAHNLRGISVIFLRYDKIDLPKINHSLLTVVNEYYSKTGNYFITITASRIRISQL